MRRNFDFDNTDGEFVQPEYDDDDNDDDDNDDEYEDDLEYEFEHLGLMEAELNQRILHSAIEVSKDSFLWIFMPLHKKLKRIQIIYNKLNELIQSEVDDADL
jgi:hypothetical protein